MVDRMLRNKNSNEKLEELFGPVNERMQARYAIGPWPPRSQAKVSFGFLLRVLKFIFLGKLRGQLKPSPFFDSADKPLVEPTVLTTSEREALRPLCGPQK